MTVAQVIRPSDAEVVELERIAAAAWPSPEQAWAADGVLLRAGEGWTGRANSALVLEAPVDPAAVAGQVLQWYAERGLDAAITVPLPVHEAVADILQADGWATRVLVPVLTGGAHDALTRLPERHDLPPVRVTGTLTSEWMSIYRDGELPDVAQSILSGGDSAFGTIVLDGRVVAVGRVSLGGDWAGLTAIEVLPSMRRRGLGSHLVRGLIAWAHERAASRLWLQVGPENQPALELYRAAGFVVHHQYRVLTAPERQLAHGGCS